MKIWKAFVEYDNPESAIEAKRNLDDFLLFNDGSRMNIYFSNLETVKFQNNNSGGVGKINLSIFLSKDYTLLECQKLVSIKEMSRATANTSFASDNNISSPTNSNGKEVNNLSEDTNPEPQARIRTRQKTHFSVINPSKNLTHFG